MNSDFRGKIMWKTTAMAIAVAILAQVRPSSHAASEFAPYADRLTKAKIIEMRVSEEEYRLQDAITRAEMAKIAVKLANKQPSECTNIVFPDVNDRLGDLCGYIETAAASKIVSKTNASFRPKDSVTRAEMVKMLLIANSTPPSDTPSGFPDVPKSMWDLALYVNAGVLQGCIKAWKSFRPNAMSTRGEAFKIAACIAGLSTPSDMPTGMNIHDANFSPETLKFLRANTGLDGEQWDNIMKLVNKPEQDSLDWTASYGYCENIGDDRGYTIGIFWATTGGPNDMWPDAPKLFKEFDRANGAIKPTTEGWLARIWASWTMSGRILNVTDSADVFCSKINNLQSDPAWREAVWRTFYEVYIEYSVQQASKLWFRDALAIGSFVDTALNQGGPSLGDLISKSWNSRDEKVFLSNFYEQRSKVVNTNRYNQPPNGTKRVQQWKDLLDKGQYDLKDVDTDILSVTSWAMQ